MLWQRTGGMQIQILKTIEHLTRKGVDVKLFDSLTERLSDYDLVHVFSAINGAHLILREARSQNVRTVLSTGLQPDCNRVKFVQYKAASWLTRKLTAYEIRTTYDNVLSAIENSDHLIVLSEGERCVLKNAYAVKEDRITLISNGIDTRFFSATPASFIEQFGINPGFILVVGSVSAYKNQLGVIHATANSKRAVLLIGPVGDSEYLRRCLDEGGTRVRHIGVLAHDDPLLGSAYASAGVTVLASAGETFGLTAVESLASGTPAIITASNGLGLSLRYPLLQFVDPQDIPKLGDAIEAALAAPQPTTDQCREMVAHFNWDTVGNKILQVYQKLTTSSPAIATI